MGVKADTQAAAANVATQQQQTTLRTQNTEDLLKQEEGLLGTSAQVGGFQGQNLAGANYSQRYSLSPSAMNAVATAYSNHENALPDVQKKLQGEIDNANSLMEQAQQAATNGDTAKADALKAQAAQAASQVGSGFGRVPVQFAVLGGGDTASQAKEQLSSPMAQGVGELVAKAKDYQNPDSVASKTLMSSLTSGADAAIKQGELDTERSITTQARATNRSIRDSALQSGAGRNITAMAATQARANDQFAMASAQNHEQAAVQRAQLFSNAQQFFTQYTNSFTQNTEAFAQNWLQNQGGIREAYQQTLDQLDTGFTQMMQNAAAAYTNSEEFVSKMIAQRNQSYMNLVGSIL